MKGNSFHPDMFERSEQEPVMIFRTAMIKDVALYLADAIRAANVNAGLSPETFRNGLAYPCTVERGGNRCRVYILGSREADGRLPSDPYSGLKLADCIRYLCYGCDRVDPNNSDGSCKLKDSLNYYEFFGIAHDENGPLEEYRQLLERTITLRNDMAHMSQSESDAASPRALAEEMRLFKALTGELTRRTGWERDRLPLSEFWKTVDTVYREQFGDETDTGAEKAGLHT